MLLERRKTGRALLEAAEHLAELLEGEVKVTTRLAHAGHDPHRLAYRDDLDLVQRLLERVKRQVEVLHRVSAEVA